MAIVSKFQRVGVGVLASALALTALSGTFNEANAQQARQPTVAASVARDTTTTRIASVPTTAPAATVPAPATAGPGFLERAAEFSKQGVSFILIVGKSDQTDYKNDFMPMLQKLESQNIDSKVFRGRDQERENTYVHFVVRGVTYTGFPVGALTAQNRDGYKISDVRSGKVLDEAASAARGAGLVRVSNAGAPTGDNSVAMNNTHP